MVDPASNPIQQVLENQRLFAKINSEQIGTPSGTVQNLKLK
jgi:hypothetical protein